MLKRISVSAALAGLALTGALCACSSATQASASQARASASVSSAKDPAPVSAQPIIFAVRLGRDFQPGSLRISPGMHFVVIVNSSVKAGGTDVPNSCSSTTAEVDGGMLSVRCTSGDFYYTAQRAGTAKLTTTVRPKCAKGTMCPQWISKATLKITIL